MSLKRLLRISTLVTVLLPFLLMGLPAAADIYQWVDEKGVVHFSDQPPLSKEKVSAVEVSPSAPPSTWQPPPKKKKTVSAGEAKKEDVPTASKERSKPSKVDLYVTSWCKYCKLARRYLAANNIPFNAYDIEKDSRAAKRKRKLDPRSGVPLAVINGKVIIGFSEASYSKALSMGR